MPKKHLTDYIPFSLAGQLKKAGYWNPGCTYSSCYNGPCFFILSKKFYADGVVSDWEDVLPAPTYAEVVDWLIEQGLSVHVDKYIRPNWIGFVSEWDVVNPYYIFESKPGSWKSVMNNCIRKALKHLKK